MSKRGISPSEEKVSAIQNAKPPKNNAEVRSCLGLVQYCAKFLPDYAQFADPLRILRRRDQHFMWGPREILPEVERSANPSTYFFYFKNECRTRIAADAGPTDLGAILTQLQDGMWRVISYASRNLTNVEMRRDSQTEKEELALVWAYERFKLYVYGRGFELETDHKPLKHIYNTSSKLCAHIEQWFLRLQGYNFRVIYCPGKTYITEALSRQTSMDLKDPSGEEADSVRAFVQESTPMAITARKVEREPEKDPELCSVRYCIQSGDRSQLQCNLLHSLSVKNGLCTVGK